MNPLDELIRRTAGPSRPSTPSCATSSTTALTSCRRACDRAACSRPSTWGETPLVVAPDVPHPRPRSRRVGQVVAADRHTAAVRFLPDYLRRVDRFEMLWLVEPARPFHPNLRDRHICLEVYPGQRSWRFASRCTGCSRGGFGSSWKPTRWTRGLRLGPGPPRRAAPGRPAAVRPGPGHHPASRGASLMITQAARSIAPGWLLRREARPELKGADPVELLERSPAAGDVPPGHAGRPARREDREAREVDLAHPPGGAVDAELVESLLEERGQGWKRREPGWVIPRRSAAPRRWP